MNESGSMKQLALTCMQWVTPLEVSAMRRIFVLRRISGLIWGMKAISRLGDWSLWVGTGIWLLAIGDRHSQLTVLAAMLAVGFSVLLFKALKNLVGRPRPFESWQGLTSLVPAPDRFSFPSGHTMTAFAVWAVLCQGASGMALFFLLIAILIGCSRVFLGMHYPTDVLVGAVLGSATGYSAARLVF